MIETAPDHEALRCTLCGELAGISPAALANKARLAQLTELMKIEHEGCQRYAHDPALAKAERIYQRRMRALVGRFG